MCCLPCSSLAMRMFLPLVVYLTFLHACTTTAQDLPCVAAAAGSNSATSPTGSTSLPSTRTSVEASPTACTSVQPPDEPSDLSLPFTGVPGTSKERSFFAIKPDGVQRGLAGEVISRFERKGWKLVGLKMLVAPRSLVEAHYEEHAGKAFFDGLVDHLCSGPSVAMVWEGPDIILGGRKMLGSTRPLEADMGTIRGDLCITAGRNLVHASDGTGSAAREIALWFSPEEVLTWSRSLDPWISREL